MRSVLFPGAALALLFAAACGATMTDGARQADDGGESSRPPVADAGGSAPVTNGPEVLTTGENAVALAIDGDQVYWLNILRVPTSEMTYTFVDVRSMPKSGGTPSTLAETKSMFAVNIVAHDGVVVWSAASCAPPCDYPGATSEQAIYTLDSKTPGGYRMITGAFGGSQVAATSTIAFSRHRNGNTGEWDLTACGIDGSGCSTIASGDGVQPALYAGDGNIYWIDAVTPASAKGKLFWNDAAPPYAIRGEMDLPGLALSMRVNGDAVAARTANDISTGTVRGQMRHAWVAQAGSDIDIVQGRVYWNQNPWSQTAGCVGSANLDGTDGKCLDEGQHTYPGVRVDDAHVWYIRDGQIVRLRRL